MTVMRFDAEASGSNRTEAQACHRTWAREGSGKRRCSRVGAGETGLLAGRGPGAGIGIGEPSRDSELHPAVGQVDDRGGEGGSPGVYGGGESDAGGEPERAAERRIRAEGGGVRATAGDPSEGRRGERDVTRVPERVADHRAAGERGDDPGLLGGGAAAGGRGVAGERRIVSGAAADAGGEPGSAVADEHAVRQAGILLGSVAEGKAAGRSGRACG